ncbi:A disintegrin and metalloproteinase with thrombospondin motifs 7 [Periophthalmus magnuspinnatus]|uniref:A disintegrin and metalloproteinase with thrombospondin motifs 7 n=1 Tax=Periophthalmus magnuspinnatus TaxID=409849 RepID=UPI00145ACB8C|nr:A disintegrin and metalloproteinase with thrombospondin motifs 7 [Periophthalmus magnuspinnatus]
MRCPQECALLLLLNFVFILAAGHVEHFDSSIFQTLFAEQGQSGSTIVHPFKTRADGAFLSHSLSHHFSSQRVRRDLRPHPAEDQVYYKVDFKGDTLVFNLSANTKLLSDDYTVERRNGGTNRTEHRSTNVHHCHYVGTVATSKIIGSAAISTCDGLRGFFSLPEGYYFIEPLQKPFGHSTEGPEPHVIYPKTTATSNRRKRSDAGDSQGPCGVQDSSEDCAQVEREREEWEREHHKEPVQSRQQRSVSRERWVETMVVADSKLIEYHGSDNVESYIFTIMNMVAGIFHDASIGNAVHVILVRLILLQGEEKGLKIVHNADTTLASFCAWQKNINPQSDTHPAHHDLAVLVTRKDICAGMNQPCETLGLSHLSGMCQPHRSCNINEDSGLPVAFTVAHEMGHSFGIHHDGQGNDCEVDGRHPFIMSRQLMYDSSPLTWSSCSKEYITRFLDRGWGFCLDDRPSKKELTTPLANLGVRYTTQHQCQLQYGPNATFCAEVDNVCQILWCSVNGSCRSKLDSPIDGTRCGPGKWCISGECVIVGKLPETVNGGWGPWSAWSFCSRTCGTGVQSADRECNSPKPEFGGKYCTGERRRYRTCNTKICLNEQPSFREMQCSEFNTVPYHNELYQWIPVTNHVNPCELHCRPVNEYFSEKMLDTVTDGTPCFMNNKSRNICVNGACKEVGCDFGIDSNAVEDHCGVCLGDGSSCETIYNRFDEGEGFGYIDVGVIPEGARDILVTEVEEAGNFLALKSHNSEEYFLNGNYIIQWNGEYEAGGTTFYYERTANMENLTASGPTSEPVILQLLYQENNPGIKYEYTIKKSKKTGNEITDVIYTWRHGAWTHCSTTCGLGEQHQPVRCVEVDVGVVDDSLCDPETQPQDRYRKCKNMECPARWWVGGWQHCTATCGSEGVRSRTVLCVRTVSGEETVLHPIECKHLLKPKRVVPCNRDIPCGQEWTIGEWEVCPVTCGGGVRSRTVTCALAPKKTCDMSIKPRSRSLCALQSCPNPSLRRRPGPPPKYRRIYPPKRQPTKPSDLTSTWFPSTTTSTAAPTVYSPTTRQSTLFNSTTSVFNADILDHEFNVVRTEKGRHLILTKKSKKTENTRNKMQEEEEEGSTPNVGMYTPGYDYITEDRTEEEIIDLDVKTTTEAKPLITTQTTRLTTRSPQPVSTLRNNKYSKRLSVSTPKTFTSLSPDLYTTQTRLPTTTQPMTTAARFQPTVKIIKPKKTAVTPKARTATSIAKKKEKGNRSKKQNISSSNQSNLTARETVVKDATWGIGNWSECSTTCGIGAMWRTVVCSSQNEEDCLHTERPEPARTCHLQPCATWQSGSWSKCPDECAVVGRRHRDVQCVDSQSRRPLRPFHCQDLSSKPISTLTCPRKLCLSWSTSPWAPCSGSCGDGVRERLVYCPEVNRCRDSVRPNSTEPCTLKPCVHWTATDWDQCSVSCGGGQQHRKIICTSVEDETLVLNDLCEEMSKPDTLRKCNEQDCKDSTGSICKKNTMSSRFCDKLKLLGRCSLRSIQKQCCVTCGS